MSAGKVFGILITLIGGFFILYDIFTSTHILSMGFEDLIINWIIWLLIGILAMVGGILGMASKGGAGTITLIAGILAFLMYLVGNLVSSADLMVWFYPYSGLNALFGWGIFVISGSGIVWVVSFEGFLIFLGAIMILISHDDV